MRWFKIGCLPDVLPERKLLGFLPLGKPVIDLNLLIQFG